VIGNRTATPLAGRWLAPGAFIGQSMTVRFDVTAHIIDIACSARPGLFDVAFKTPQISPKPRMSFYGKFATYAAAMSCGWLEQ
jgi:hypothetical protein